jgi:hypothetical protein
MTDTMAIVGIMFCCVQIGYLLRMLEEIHRAKNEMN